MDRKKTIIKNLKRFKKEISQEIKVDKMIFFGSRMYGKPRRHSDIDIIVVSKKFNKLRFIKRSFELYKKWDLNYPVDILCYTPKEFNSLKKQITIVREAVKRGIEI